ncbi:MAG: trehalose-phosphatase [Actinomycetota bacterium]|nr:trehalose-phosphatase [Actinomycetota bacterium]
MTGTESAAQPALPRPPGWAELGRHPCALFLDVDGTLLEFEEHPDLVRATEGLVSLLTSVESALDGALAVISGRPLDDLDRVFAPWRPLGAGIHGAEVRDRAGEHRFDSGSNAVAPIRAQVERIVATVPGAWTEDKGTSLAVHHRAAPDAGAVLVERLTPLAQEGSGFAILQGVLVVELRPSSHDKGTALEELMDQPPFAGRTPVVVGDDTTDEDAFVAVGRRGGLAVIVGPRAETAASYRLPDPAAVRGWLTELIEEVRP